MYLRGGTGRCFLVEQNESDINMQESKDKTSRTLALPPVQLLQQQDHHNNVLQPSGANPHAAAPPLLLSWTIRSLISYKYLRN